jgi:amino acid transporter
MSDPAPAAADPLTEATIRTADQPVDHRLRRSLGLRDLIPMQVLLVLGFNWPGIAGHEGPTHVVFWLAGVLLLFLPVAGVVQYCTRIWPLEGGVYQWTRHALGPFCGFLSAWNFGLWALLIVSALGLSTATSLSYALGPQAGWMVESGVFVGVLNIMLFTLILLVNIPGMGLGRWVAHFGTGVNLLITSVLVTLLFVHPAATHAHPYVAPQASFSLALPTMTLVSLNLFCKLSFNGLTGLEQAAVFAGEIRDPSRSILRSAWIGAPLIALIYILMTGSLLAYTPADKIDLIGPLQQVLATAFGAGTSGARELGVFLGRAAILILALATAAQYAVIVAETSRLPLVAAWDHLLPPWFMKLHPKYRTPTRSLAVIAAVAVVLGILASVGAGAQETFQILATAGNLCYGINYLLMFAVPLAVGSRFGVRPGLLLRLGCIAGALVTLATIVFSLIPIVDVKDVGVYAFKVGMSALALNLVGVALYWRGKYDASRASAACR